jgi:hypothetical protein
VPRSTAGAENPDKVKLLAGPYVWGDLNIPGVGAISGYPLPLPAGWRVPRREKVEGFAIASGARRKPLKMNESAPEEAPYTGGHPEIMIEFARPERASTVTGVTVDYRIGWQAFRKTFDMSLTMCPRNESGPCDQP